MRKAKWQPPGSLNWQKGEPPPDSLDFLLLEIKLIAPEVGKTHKHKMLSFARSDGSRRVNEAWKIVRWAFVLKKGVTV